MCQIFKSTLSRKKVSTFYSGYHNCLRRWRPLRASPQLLDVGMGHLDKAQSDRSFPAYCSTICSNLETQQPIEPLNNTIPWGSWKAPKSTYFLLYVLRLLTQDYLGVLPSSFLFFLFFPPKLTHLATESLLQKLLSSCSRVLWGGGASPEELGQEIRQPGSQRIYCLGCWSRKHLA